MIISAWWLRTSQETTGKIENKQLLSGCGFDQIKANNVLLAKTKMFYMNE